jgi:hypothetical protein
MSADDASSQPPMVIPAGMMPIALARSSANDRDDTTPALFGVHHEFPPPQRFVRTKRHTF